MSKGSNRRPEQAARLRQNWDALDWSRGKRETAVAFKGKPGKPKKSEPTREVTDSPRRPHERCPFCRQILKRCGGCKHVHCTSANGLGCVPIVRCKNPPRKRNWTKEIYETTPQGFIVNRGGMVDGPSQLDSGPKLAGTEGQGPAWDRATSEKREDMRIR